MSNVNRSKDIEVMNDLLSLCIDSAKGYREAAEICNMPSLCQLFTARAAERDQVAAEFSGEISRLGGTPNQHGTLAGSAHRLMMDLRAVAGDDAKTTIEEIEHCEDVIKDAFQKAMQNALLTPDARAMITRLFAPIRAGHEQMSALKHSAA